jgi:acetyl-CoA carboxylase biotin carboxylase subunit
MIAKLLIANRGEIALRIHRAAKELGMATVAVHSTADADAMHVRLADESVCIGPAASKDSYLNMPAILSAAAITGADAIHPGIGFLAENARFAEMVEDHGLIFVGPSAEHILLMGDKLTAKEAATKLGIPIVPGTPEPVEEDAVALAFAEEVGYPVLVKAAGGGGGKGMKVVMTAEEMPESLSIARREAQTHFGNPAVYIEKYLPSPRHIEVQILADKFGNAVHLGERDCSLQRRHQKLLEEAPSPILTPDQRAELGAQCVNAVKELGYYGVGTFEFLYQDGQFYFIEMNTRLQVEHPVTEMITGIDLVRQQLLVAAGEKLPFKQKDIKFTGHAMECRLNAENPISFAPRPGKISDYHAPGGFGVRVDSALYNGYRVPSHYDSLVAKLIVHGNDRATCVDRLKRALGEFVILGIETTLPLFQQLLEDPDFLASNFDVKWLEGFVAELQEKKAA